MPSDFEHRRVRAVTHSRAITRSATCRTTIGPAMLDHHILCARQCRLRRSRAIQQVDVAREEADHLLRLRDLEALLLSVVLHVRPPVPYQVDGEDLDQGAGLPLRTMRTRVDREGSSRDEGEEDSKGRRAAHLPEVQVRPVGHAEGEVADALGRARSPVRACK